MLTLLGFGMVVTFMALIMFGRLSPMVALILIPIVFALIGGFGGSTIGPMMLDGIEKLAPTGVMLMFAILYFGIMIDAGLFDPIVRLILRLVDGDPVKVVLGTAILAAIVSLDGDGSTTYMIVTASMLPLYRRLGMDALNLTCVTILAGGVMNLTPWGGPLARAASALQIEPEDIFLPMLPTMAIGIAGVFLVAYHLGLKERRRLGVVTLAEPMATRLAYAGQPSGLDAPVQHRMDEPVILGIMAPASDPGGLGDARPVEAGLAQSPVSGAARYKLLINAALTAALLVALVMALLPLPVLFMLAFAIALFLNYPDIEDQRARIAEHSKNVIAVVSLIFAAGVFTGVLGGTGMVDAMSKAFLGMVPPSWGSALAPITAIASMPFTFFISNDAFYFGVLPVVSEAAGHYGISGAQMARASLIGQPVHLLSPLVPSTYLLVGLAGVDFGEHQRFTLKWAVLVCLLMLASTLVFSDVPLISR